MITSFSGLYQKLQNTQKRVLVIANGVDAHSIEAAHQAVHDGLVDVILTGDQTKILQTIADLGFDASMFVIVHADDDLQALAKAVLMARSGEANMLMKGFVSTDKFMRAILNKETGILPKGKVLSHVTVLKNPMYHKLLVIGDVAVIPQPTLEQKACIISYQQKVARALDIHKPKFAFLAATEQVLKSMPATIEADELAKLHHDRDDMVCAGPVALDVAIDKAAAELKGITHEVAGDADCLLFPNIEAGNIFYKTNTKFCQAETAAVLVGTDIPVVLSSRGDVMKTKVNSIALAALLH